MSATISLSPNGKKSFSLVPFSTVVMAVVMYIFSAAPAQAVDTHTGLESAATSTPANGTISVTGNISYTASQVAVVIDNSGVSIVGHTASSVTSGTIIAAVTGMRNDFDPINEDKDALKAVVVKYTTPIDTALASTSLRAIVPASASAIRQNTTAGTDNMNTINALKIVNFNTGGTGLNIKNLQFRDFVLNYYYTTTAANGGGIVNPFVGSIHSIAGAISYGTISGNDFSNIKLTMISPNNYDKTYLAGGAIVGLRSTANEATVTEVSGNTFREIEITTTNATNNYTLGMPYIEGGGIVGINAGSSPDTYTVPIQSRLDLLTGNYFTSNTVNSGDVIMGGGIVGLNNNNRQNPKTYTNEVRLRTASYNIFTSNTVRASYTLRGGGVIGLNGLSNAHVYLDNLNYNVFSDIAVESGTYLRGGGIVGLQTFDNNANTGGTAVPEVSAILDKVTNNTFIGITVTSGTRAKTQNLFGGDLMGGGIIGVHARTGEARINLLENNYFEGITVTTLTQNGTTTNNRDGDLEGGGIIGVNSNKEAVIGTFQYNFFEDININVASFLGGGGIIGVAAYADDVGQDPDNKTIFDTIYGNLFANITVQVGKDIYGGGVIGAETVDGTVVAYTININEFDHIWVQGDANKTGTIYGGGLFGITAVDGTAALGLFSENKVYDVTVKDKAAIEGGGILGVTTGVDDYELTRSALITTIEKSDFEQNHIQVSGRISGGGIVGVYASDGVGELYEIQGTNFYNNVVVAGTYIDGGGIVGVTGAQGTGQSNSLGIIQDSLFFGNQVHANEGQILGGLVYVYGNDADLLIQGSVFASNTFVSTVNTGSSSYDTSLPTSYGAKVYGTVTIDTGLARTNPGPITVTLQALNNDYVDFEQNVIYENGATRNSSLYIGNTFGSTTDDQGKIIVTEDYVDADAWLKIVTGGSGQVRLIDPIVVDQTDSEESTHYFKMTVSGDGSASGYFQWAGANTFTVNNTTHSADNSLTFLAPSRTILYPGMSLKAPGHDLVLTQGTLSNRSNDAYWQVLGWDAANNNNRFEVYSAKLSGTIYFVITSTDDLNNAARAPLTIIPDSTKQVDVTNLQVQISNFTGIVAPSINDADRFYLIDTGSAGSITGTPVSTTTAYYIDSNGDAHAYVFIVDFEIGDEITDKDGNTNRYLVARLQPTVTPDPEPVPEPAPDPPAPPVQPLPPDPPSGGDTPPEPVTPDTPAPEPAPEPPAPPEPPVTPEPQPAQPVEPPVDPGPFPPTPPTPPGPTPEPSVPDYEIIPEGHAAALAYAANIGTWLPDHSYQAADLAIQREDAWQLFAGMDGSWFEIKTDAKIQLQGPKAILGIARKSTNDRGGKWLLGGYVEAGRMLYYIDGNFVTANSQNLPVAVEAKGDIRSLGIGILTRYTWKNKLRIEGSFRAGRLENRFWTDNFYLTTNDLVRYNYRTPYMGAHLGIGYVKDINDISRIDFVARYYWTHLRGENVDVGGGTMVNFAKSNSHRARGGLRYTRDTTPRFSWYSGAYLEYEFSNRARASHDDVTFREPSLRGATGVLEFGGIGRFKNHEDVSIEFGVQGYAGKYKGVSGGFRIGFEF
jgi:hypothetical protein